jgi:NAD(P)-dependent dehydrogenase (short-subunit alcohol dehydrogenase family)
MFTEKLIAEQKQDLPILATKENTAGRTFIVTGANSGLGLEAARHYVALGAAKVIMAVRNVAVGEAARADIEASTGAGAGAGVAEVLVWALDLASYASVQAFAARAVAELDRLDALIENAALALDSWTVAEGHETSTTVNVYGTFLLGVLLLSKLRETAARFGGAGGGNVLPHLVVVTSGAALVVKDLFMAIKDDPMGKMDDEQNPGIMGR